MVNLHDIYRNKTHAMTISPISLDGQWIFIFNMLDTNVFISGHGILQHCKLHVTQTQDKVPKTVCG